MFIIYKNGGKLKKTRFIILRKSFLQTSITTIVHNTLYTDWHTYDQFCTSCTLPWTD